MKLTYEVPEIIIDNTKTEQLVELITKTSSSLEESGSILVSKGDGTYDIITIDEITSSLISDITAETPLKINKDIPTRPQIVIDGLLPVSHGGTATGSVISDRFLYAKGNGYKFIDIKSGSTELITVSRDSSDNIIIDSTLYWNLLKSE